MSAGAPGSSGPRTPTTAADDNLALAEHEGHEHTRDQILMMAS